MRYIGFKGDRVRNEWQRTSEKILGFRAIRNKVTRELCLAGSKGEVWVKNESTLSVVLRGGKRRKDALLRLATPLPSSKDSELQISFTPDKLPKVLKLIKYSPYAIRQVRYANAF